MLSTVRGAWARRGEIRGCEMETEEPQAFSGLVRAFRKRAGLTQEELAARAGLSLDAVGLLERGERRRPQRETIRLLAAALGLSDAERTRFAAVARAPGPEQPPALPTPAAPLPSVAPPTPHTLPAPVTSLVGRVRAVADVIALLRRPDARLVSLTGPGGVGKTRLALAVAAGYAEGRDDVAFVSLASVREAGLLLPSVAQGVGVPKTDPRPAREALVAALRERRLLLVLDNFEHLLSEAVEVANLLAHCPGLRVLVTSREALRLQGEHVRIVAPLALPDAEATAGDVAVVSVVSVVGASPAVTLFCQRAEAVDERFALTTANTVTIAAICARLDGLPLALELAAARLRYLSPDALLTRLTRRLPELADGPRDVPARHHTMAGAIAWSYDLLAPDEAAAFRRLAVFVGGCTEAAAVAVCGGDDTEAVMRALASLVDKSLVQVTHGETPRFTMLETVREYADEQLTRHDERAEAQRRHAGVFLALAEAAEPLLRQSADGGWSARLHADHDNLRVALRWSLDIGGNDDDIIMIGVRLVGALWYFWYIQSFFREGRSWLDAFIARAEQTNDANISPARAVQWANVFGGAAQLAYMQSDLERALTLSERALALRGIAGDAAGMAFTLNSIGSIVSYRGEYARAVSFFTRSLALRRTIGDRAGVAATLNNLGDVAMHQGQYTLALMYLDESESGCRQVGNRQILAIVISNRGHIARYQGEYVRAAAYHAESMALRREVGDRDGYSASVINLGEALLRQGDVAGAAARFAESLALYQQLDTPWGLAYAWYHLGRAAWAGGDRDTADARYREALRYYGHDKDIFGTTETLERLAETHGAGGAHTEAVRLWAIAAALRTRMDAPVPPCDQADFDRAITAVRATLGEKTFAAAWENGAALTLDEAIAEALAPSSAGLAEAGAVLASHH